METRKLPVGIQSFETIRNGSANYLYVDKTELIFKLVSTDTPVFLNRPRRFGKSLLVSTMQAYFEGRKELFEGLAMETQEKDWTVYPVFKFDLSRDKYETTAAVEETLSEMLAIYEKQFGLTTDHRMRVLLFQISEGRQCGCLHDRNEELPTRISI